MSAGAANVVPSLGGAQNRKGISHFRTGDTVRVHVRIIEGAKERIQIFHGVVIRRRRRNQPNATFTVRKVSYGVGVERTFLVHSPRLENVEIVNRGIVRRAKLFYLRGMRGKKSKIKSQLYSEILGGGEQPHQDPTSDNGDSAMSTPQSAVDEQAPADRDS